MVWYAWEFPGHRGPLSVPNNLRITSYALNQGGGGPPLQGLPANVNRVWVIVTLPSGGQTFIISNMSNGLPDSSFDIIVSPITQDYLRKDYGPLVQGEWWFSDGVGNWPGGQVIITEGVII